VQGEFGEFIEEQHAPIRERAGMISQHRPADPILIVT